MVVQLLIFALGAIFSLFVQLVASRLALARDQRKESWMRRLNSYQDFFQSTRQLLDLWRAGIAVSEDRAWGILLVARKAVYDPERGELAQRMQALSVDLLLLVDSDPRDPEQLDRLAAESEEVLGAFLESEPSLRSLRRPRKLDPQKPAAELPAPDGA
jgi:hypothetical protein